MLTLVMLAAIGQVYEVDYYFTLRQEEWIIDQLPPHPGYTQFIPKALAEQVNLWHEPCHRCRKAANEVIAANPDNLRWMFWTSHSLSVQVQLHSEAIINHLIICQKCDGVGYCTGFLPDPAFKASCLRCYSGAAYHDDSHPDRPCVGCEGRGYFENWPDCPWRLRTRTY